MQAEVESERSQSAVDIEEILSLDAKVINYGRFLCGRVLGSTIEIKNTSSKDQVLSISID